MIRNAPDAPSSSAPSSSGPSAASSAVRLRVEGMHCASCAANVQRAIEAEPGVESASVSVTEGLATVSGRDLVAGDLVAAIERSGYGAEPVAAGSAPAERRSAIEVRQAANERSWRRRAIIGLGLWVPMAALHWIAGPALWVEWILAAGATVVLATAGAGFYRSAWSAARRGTTNMDTLISIGATTAYGFSLVVFAAARLGTDLAQPLYFSEAAALLGIISLGHWLEARAGARAGSSVRELLELQPDEAERLDADGTPQAIPSAEIRPGDRILIRPGDRVPVDGVVTEGSSDVDEAVVTGESRPVPKVAGDGVVAGSNNTTGRLVIEASVDGAHTTIARIADLVQDAQASKAEIQRLADFVSSIFVPTVLAIAAVTFVGWWIAGDLGRGIVACVTVLIISCPCALGLATPMAVMVGTGAASRRGILVKSAAALERAGRAARIVFDKTGTLTRGAPVLRAITPRDGTGEEEVLRLAAAVETPSEHPVARAIVEAARARGLDVPAVDDFAALPGAGVRGVVGGRSVEVTGDETATCRVVRDGAVIGTIDAEDTLRDDAPSAVRRLRAMGLDVRVLTGDRADVAAAVAEELGIEPADVDAGATPESKEELVGRLGAGTIMVGDGINDAAALARADLGIAMASGTNIAIESADVVIPGSHVGAVPDTIALARDTLRTIRQNLFFAFVYNAAAIPAAAFGLLGAKGPLIAAAAMAVSDITVIGNALRLKARLNRARRG